MAPPVPIFPSSELSAMLLTNTDTVTTTSPYTKQTREKKVLDPITSEKLDECEMMRLFQYDCKVVPMAVREISSKQDTAVRCIEYERRYWKCGERMIEDPSSAVQWRRMQDKIKTDKEDRRRRQTKVLQSSRLKMVESLDQD